MNPDRCDLLCLDLERAEVLRRERLGPEAADGLAVRARALSDPLRLGIAHALRDGDELCVCDLSWIMERSEQVVSHHLRHLRRAGFASSRRDGRMVMYRLTENGQAWVNAGLALVQGETR